MSQILKQSIGIDMAKDKFDACFSIIDNLQKVTVKSTRKFTNTVLGFQEFDSWVKKHTKQEVALVYVVEATGVYYEKLAWHLFNQGAYLSVLLPNKAKKYSESLGLKSKNDKIDAKGLSRMAAEQGLNKWEPLSIDFYVLRSLTRERESIQDIKTVLYNQIHALKHSYIQSNTSIKRLEKHLTLLKKQLDAIEEEIKATVDKNPEIKSRIEKIIKVKGLGLMSVVTVLAECNGFALINNQKQLVSYAGLDVVENQSGKKKGKTRISKKGNAHIRRILYMPAFSTVKYEPRFNAFYSKLIENGKKKMQAYVAVQKKLLVLIYTLWKKNEEYQRKQDDTFGNEEPKSLFSLLNKNVSVGDAINNSPRKSGATQDELPCNESPEALFSLIQRY